MNEAVANCWRPTPSLLPRQGRVSFNESARRLSPRRSATRWMRPPARWDARPFEEYGIVNASDTIFERSRYRVAGCARRHLTGPALSCRNTERSTRACAQTCRIISLRQRDNRHAQAAVHEKIQTTQCGAHACCIRIDSSTTFETNRRISCTWSGVSAVPGSPQRCTGLPRCSATTSKYPSTMINVDIDLAVSLANSSAKRVCPFLKSGVSGEFRYLGFSFPIVRPPNAIMRFRRSVIGNMTLARKRS